MADIQYASSAMSTYFPHSPWHPIYSLARDAVKCMLKLRALNVYTKIKAALAIKLAEGMRESGSLHFKTAPPRAATNTTTTTTTIDATVPSPACPSLDETDVVLNDVSSRRWGVDECRPNQLIACKKILFGLSSAGKLLVVDRTGGGKSHILRMTVVMVNGIILVIVPLLALTANQMANIMNAMQVDGSIEAHNLDDTSRTALHDIVIPRMDKIPYDTSSKIFLLSSPQ